MKKSVAKKWINALLSGKYKQGVASLSSGGAFCCLGVLCEVAKQEGVISDYDGSEYWPSEKVQEWAGMKTKNGRLLETSLTDLNDNGIHLDTEHVPMTFEDIAAVIQMNVDEL